MGAGNNLAIAEGGPPSLRAEFVERIYAAWHKSRETILALGNALIEAKKALPHGQFTAMIEQDLPFGPDTARKFMRLVLDPRIADHGPTHVLPASAEAMDRLRRLNDLEFEAAIATGRIHANMTVKDSRDLIRELGRQHDIQTHRPDAATPAAIPREPKDGIAQNYSQLVWLLCAARKGKGISQEELNARAGMQDGYMGKLERPDSLYGRSAVHPTFDLWLGGLRVGLKVVDLG